MTIPSSVCKDPEHVAIIMDGNGRWAKARGLPRQAGHERGVESLRRTVEAVRSYKTRHLSVFSFSTENWKRPAGEINSLFGLLRAYVNRDLERLAKEGIRIRIPGSRSGVPDDIIDLIEKAERRTEENTRFHLNIAFNYGGREEIVEACRSLSERAKNGEIEPGAIDEAMFQGALWTASQPAPDLLIRTSGERRISNFMLWQLAYTEFVFCDTLWPDFGADALAEAIALYRDRDRRFGGVPVDGSVE